MSRLDSASHAVALIWTILGIELTLLWNSVSGVYAVDSTGQLIPLVIGSASLVPIAYKSCLVAFPASFPSKVRVSLYD